MDVKNEQRLARIGLNNFLAEFSYADLEYEASQGENELGDHLLVLGNNALIFETKERNLDFEQDSETEVKWFRQNILRESITQHSKSQQRLSDKKALMLTNQAGHSLPLPISKSTQIQRITTYTCGQSMPVECLGQRAYESSRVGFVHILSQADYELICRKLILPSEIFEYFHFREKLLKKYGSIQPGITEYALLGQFIRNTLDDTPSIKNEAIAKALPEDTSAFDLFTLLSGYRDHIVEEEDSETSDTNYYPILKEIAQLDRVEARILKERLDAIINDTRGPQVQPPIRVGIPRTGCCFVIATIPHAIEKDVIKALKAFTEAGKYSLQMDRAIGIGCVREPGGLFIQWMYTDHAWKKNEELELRLKETELFTEAKYRVLERYEDLND